MQSVDTLSDTQTGFTTEEIVRAFSGLLAPLADPISQVLLRSDIAPNVVKGTGVWVDYDVDGDEHGGAEEYLGFGLILKDAVDAETKEPFTVRVKVHRPSFQANPKRYALSLIAGLSRGIGKMEAEMRFTESREGKRVLKEAAKRRDRLTRIQEKRAKRTLH